MKNNHLQRFMNSNKEYLLEKLMEDKLIIDIVSYIYLCNKIATVNGIIMYFTSDIYKYRKSITHIKDILNTLEYFKIISKSAKIIRLDRKGIQLIEEKINITRASTNCEYLYLDRKSKFISACLLRLQSACYKKNIEINLLKLCRINGQYKAIKENVIITKYNVAIMFTQANSDRSSILRKAEVILTDRNINEEKKITIMYVEESYRIQSEILNEIFNLYNINYLSIDTNDF